MFSQDIRKAASPASQFEYMTRVVYPQSFQIFL